MFCRVSKTGDIRTRHQCFSSQTTQCSDYMFIFIGGNKTIVSHPYVHPDKKVRHKIKLKLSFDQTYCSQAHVVDLDHYERPRTPFYKGVLISRTITKICLTEQSRHFIETWDGALSELGLCFLAVILPGCCFSSMEFSKVFRGKINLYRGPIVQQEEVEEASPPQRGFGQRVS